MEENVRQMSNKRNIVCLIIGIVLMLIFSVQILCSIFFIKRKWPEQNMDLLFLFLGVVGLVLVLLSVVNIISIIDINKYLKNPAYGLDYQRELSTYSIIGKKSKAKNGASKFHKYTEWKEYIEEKFKRIINNEDAYRFMIRRLRSKESYKEIIISVAIPVEVGVFTVFYSAGIGVSEIGTILSILFSSAFLIILVTVNYYDCKEEINFISDFIEIVFPKMNNKQ